MITNTCCLRSFYSACIIFSIINLQHCFAYYVCYVSVRNEWIQVTQDIRPLLSINSHWNVIIVVWVSRRPPTRTGVPWARRSRGCGAADGGRCVRPGCPPPPTSRTCGACAILMLLAVLLYVNMSYLHLWADDGLGVQVAGSSPKHILDALQSAFRAFLVDGTGSLLGVELASHRGIWEFWAYMNS